MFRKSIFLVLAALILVFCPICSGEMAFADTGAKADVVKANILIESSSGTVLEEQNSKTRMPIASVTKLTTLLLAYEAIERGELKLDDILTASEEAAGMGGSQVFIDANSEYKVEDLLKAIVVASANDACVVIAEKLGGSEEGFVNLMNKRVAELGCENTNYTNCSGLPSANAFSCANDVALIMREVIKHPVYFEMSKIWMEDFLHPSGRVTQMANTNKLLRQYTGCDAGKTGSTNEAGFCMSATAKKADMRLIAVVLGADTSKNRFEAVKELFNYGFGNYQSECILSSANTQTAQPEIKKSKFKDIEFRPIDDYYAISKKGEKRELSVIYEFDNDLCAPIAKDTVIGKAIITENEVVIAKVDLINVNDIEKRNFRDGFKSIVDKWFI